MLPESEKVGQAFLPEKLTASQSAAWEAIHAIASRIQPGMLETDARDLAGSILQERGVTRFWHRTHVRFGVNTLCGFAETSLPGVRLQDNDIFFLDIGPVWDGHEADAGATFTVGEEAEMIRCARDSKVLFGLVRNRWEETGDNGNALYAFAQQQARELGWVFCLKAASGHRISDFPHVLYHRGSMEKLEFRPAPQRWVLEIQLRHPTRRFGAFFEDILG